MANATAIGNGTIRPEEAAHFGKLAADWWDPKGSSAMLHRLGPVRLGFLREAIDAHWRRRFARLAGRSPASARSMSAAARGCCANRWRGWARR